MTRGVWLVVALLALSGAAWWLEAGGQEGTYVSGVIAGEEVWTPEGSPYIVNGTLVVTGRLVVEAGVEVVVEPGVLVVVQGEVVFRGGGSPPRVSTAPDSGFVVDGGVLAAESLEVLGLLTIQAFDGGAVLLEGLDSPDGIVVLAPLTAERAPLEGAVLTIRGSVLGGLVVDGAGGAGAVESIIEVLNSTLGFLEARGSPALEDSAVGLAALRPLTGGQYDPYISIESASGSFIMVEAGGPFALEVWSLYNSTLELYGAYSEVYIGAASGSNVTVANATVAGGPLGLLVEEAASSRVTVESSRVQFLSLLNMDKANVTVRDAEVQDASFARLAGSLVLVEGSTVSQTLSFAHLEGSLVFVNSTRAGKAAVEEAVVDSTVVMAGLEASRIELTGGPMERSTVRIVNVSVGESVAVVGVAAASSTVELAGGSVPYLYASYQWPGPNISVYGAVLGIVEVSGAPEGVTVYIENSTIEYGLYAGLSGGALEARFTVMPPDVSFNGWGSLDLRLNWWGTPCGPSAPWSPFTLGPPAPAGALVEPWLAVEPWRLPASLPQPPPEPLILVEPETPVAGAPAYFRVADPGGALEALVACVSYGDGTVEAVMAPEAVHAYQAPGSYNVTLVAAWEGVVATAAWTLVEVAPPPETPGGGEAVPAAMLNITSPPDGYVHTGPPELAVEWAYTGPAGALFRVYVNSSLEVETDDPWAVVYLTAGVWVVEVEAVDPGTGAVLARDSVVVYADYSPPEIVFTRLELGPDMAVVAWEARDDTAVTRVVVRVNGTVQYDGPEPRGQLELGLPATLEVEAYDVAGRRGFRAVQLEPPTGAAPPEGGATPGETEAEPGTGAPGGEGATEPPSPGGAGGPLPLDALRDPDLARAAPVIALPLIAGLYLLSRSVRG